MPSLFVIYIYTNLNSVKDDNWNYSIVEQLFLHARNSSLLTDRILWIDYLHKTAIQS